DVILEDRTIAVCSPRLFGLVGRDPGIEQMLELPILLDTPDAWSWHQWCQAAGAIFKPRRGSIVLDTDEASIDACLSGLGVAQASPDFVEGELRSGQLVVLRPNVIAHVGAYFLARPPSSPLGASFQDWIEAARF